MDKLLIKDKPQSYTISYSNKEIRSIFEWFDSLPQKYNHVYQYKDNDCVSHELLHDDISDIIENSIKISVSGPYVSVKKDNAIISVEFTPIDKHKRECRSFCIKFDEDYYISDIENIIQLRMLYYHNKYNMRQTLFTMSMSWTLFIIIIIFSTYVIIATEYYDLLSLPGLGLLIVLLTGPKSTYDYITYRKQVLEYKNSISY
jgi:hypothetical protein